MSLISFLPRPQLKVVLALSTFCLEGGNLGAISLGEPGAEALPPRSSKESAPISQRDV